MRGDLVIAIPHNYPLLAPLLTYYLFYMIMMIYNNFEVFRHILFVNNKFMSSKCSPSDKEHHDIKTIHNDKFIVHYAINL